MVNAPLDLNHPVTVQHADRGQTPCRYEYERLGAGPVLIARARIGRGLASPIAEHVRL